MSSSVKIIAGIAVIAMVFVGVGYAITYTASTTVTDNEIESAYITVNEGIANADAKLFNNAKIPYNTTTSNTGAVTKTAIKSQTVSNTGTIKIAKTNLSGTTCTVVLTESGSNIINDRFTMTLGGQTGVYNSTAKTWTFTAVPLSDSGTSNILILSTASSGSLVFTDAEIEALGDGISFGILCSLEVA